MSYKIIKKQMQHYGEFNGGEILENKPVTYEANIADCRPFSNLFYWAHAWCDNGSTIGLHPHQGFEIMSFVLKGSLEHYDTKNKSWLPLQAGDVQIIRAGSGISHSEKMNPGSHMFQIWFDPDLSKTLEKPASYNDYKDKDFPLINNDFYDGRILIGDNSPIVMDTSDIEVIDVIAKKEIISFELNPDYYYSFYLIDGKISIDSQSLKPDDFLKVENEIKIDFNCEINSRIFVMKNPKKLNYRTYFEMRRR